MLGLVFGTNLFICFIAPTVARATARVSNLLRAGAFYGFFTSTSETLGLFCGELIELRLRPNHKKPLSFASFSLRLSKKMTSACGAETPRTCFLFKQKKDTKTDAATNARWPPSKRVRGASSSGDRATTCQVLSLLIVKSSVLPSGRRWDGPATRW